MSAVHVGVTRGSGIVSSAADMLWMRGVGEVCVCAWLGTAWVEKEVSGLEDWLWALPILSAHGECWTCVCVWVAVVWMV